MSRACAAGLALALSGVLFAPLGCDFAQPGPGAAAGEWEIHSLPVDGAGDVALHERLVVQLDRLVLPRSVNPSVVRLISGTVRVPTSVRFMPVQREIWIDLEPDAALDPETEYLLRIDGLVDLDGNELGKPYTAQFSTGVRDGVAAALPSVDPVAVLQLLHSRCADGACHDATRPASGLDLSSYAGIARTAIGALSVVAAGTTDSAGARGAFTLAGLRIIDVVAGRGQPATSLLIYKLLGDDHVAGEPMPPSGPLLARAERELLSTWIETGARGP